MLPVVVSNDTKLVLIGNDQPLLLKLIPVSEPDKSALREPEEIDTVEVVF